MYIGHAVSEENAHPSLWYWFDQLSVKDERKQSPSSDGSFCVSLVATRVVWSHRRSRDSNTVTAQGFSEFFHVTNKNSNHLLIVLPKGGLSFAIWSMVAADLFYAGDFCSRLLLDVDGLRMVPTLLLGCCVVHPAASSSIWWGFLPLRSGLSLRSNRWFGISILVRLLLFDYAFWEYLTGFLNYVLRKAFETKKYTFIHLL